MWEVAQDFFFLYKHIIGLHTADATTKLFICNLTNIGLEQNLHQVIVR